MRRSATDALIGSPSLNFVQVFTLMPNISITCVLGQDLKRASIRFTRAVSIFFFCTRESGLEGFSPARSLSG